MSSLKQIVSLGLAVALALGLPGVASAAPVVLDFEGASNTSSLDNFYNGGTDSSGASGVNYGISFSENSLALIDADEGGTGNFAHEPSGKTILFFSSGGAATVNVAAGFSTGFSFYYTRFGSGFVNVYDGLNGTGTLLATIDLVRNIDRCSGDPGGDFCHFDAIGAAFAGTAHSIDFGGTADQIGFDNITFGAVVPGPGGTVPEPGTFALLGLAAFGIGVARRRKQQK